MAHQRKLAQPQKDGKPLRDHLAAAAKASPFARRELEGPPMPESLRHLWEWFMQLHVARSYGPHGPNPISFTEMQAWARMTGTQLTPRDVDMLRGLDLTWMVGPPKQEVSGGG